MKYLKDYAILTLALPNGKIATTAILKPEALRDQGVAQPYIEELLKDVGL